MKQTIILMLLWAWVGMLFAQNLTSTAEDSTNQPAKADSVRWYGKAPALFLKGETAIRYGKIVDLTATSLLFDQEKAGAFYDPEPVSYNLADVAALADEHGWIVYGELPKRYVVYNKTELKGQFEAAQRMALEAEAKYKKSLITLVDFPDQIVSGVILRISSEGIVFDPARTSPTFDPQPQFYEFHEIKTLVNLDGTVLIGEELDKVAQKKGRSHAGEFLNNVPKKSKYETPFRSRFSLEYGFSNRLGYNTDALPPAFHPYLEDLAKGSCINFEIGLPVRSGFGIGVKIARHTSIESMEDVVLWDENGETITEGKMMDHITIQFIGPTIFYYHKISDAVYLHAGAAFGDLRFENRARLGNIRAVMKHSTVGGNFSLACDYLLNKYIALGASVSLITGSMTEAEVNGVPMKLDEEKESLTQLNMSAGAKFYF